MRTSAQIVRDAAHMLDFDAPLGVEEEALLRAALHYIRARLGEVPLPASMGDLAAEAHDAGYEAYRRVAE